jgi:hypothetical protein
MGMSKVIIFFNKKIVQSQRRHLEVIKHRDFPLKLDLGLPKAPLGRTDNNNGKTFN